MPVRDPERRREIHRRAQSRRRAAQAEATATAWCPVCGRGCADQRAVYIHEHVHEKAS